MLKWVKKSKHKNGVNDLPVIRNIGGRLLHVPFRKPFWGKGWPAYRHGRIKQLFFEILLQN
jgi:hypothetical protein